MARARTRRDTREFVDHAGTPVAVGTRVRALYPNDGIGLEGTVVELIRTRAHKPFRVETDEGRVCWFNKEWTEVAR